MNSIALKTFRGFEMTDEIPEDFKQLYDSLTLPTTTDDEFQIALKMYEACKAKWCVSAPSVAETEKAFAALVLEITNQSGTTYGLPYQIYLHMAAQLEAANAKVVELETDRKQGEKDYCALMERHDQMFVRLAAIDAEVGDNKDVVAALRELGDGALDYIGMCDGNNTSAGPDAHKTLVLARNGAELIEQLAAEVVELQDQVQRGLSVVTAAVHLCNTDATHDRHALLFSLDQALVDNGFKVKK